MQSTCIQVGASIAKLWLSMVASLRNSLEGLFIRRLDQHEEWSALFPDLSKWFRAPSLCRKSLHGGQRCNNGTTTSPPG
jgi:hypothetical protein